MGIAISITPSGTPSETTVSVGAATETVVNVSERGQIGPTGPSGASGPNDLSTGTTTEFLGQIVGDGSNVGVIKFNLTGIVPPNSTDDENSGYEVNSEWVDVVADEKYVCLDATAGSAVWKSTTSGGGSGGDMYKSVYDTDDDGVVDNSTLFDGMNTGEFYLASNPSGYVDASHTHDDRYYTEAEVNTISGALKEDAVFKTGDNGSQYLTGDILFDNRPTVSGIDVLLVGEATAGGVTSLDALNGALTFADEGTVTITNDGSNTITISGASSASADTMSNLGDGSGVYFQKAGGDFELKSFKAGANISITGDNDQLTIIGQDGGSSVTVTGSAAVSSPDFTGINGIDVVLNGANSVEIDGGAFSQDGHTHLEADVTDLDKYTVAEVNSISGALQTDIDGHTHVEADITNLDKYAQAEVDVISGALRTDLTNHTHTESDITDLDKYTTAEVDVISGALRTDLTNHTHTESDITDLDKYTQAEVNSISGALNLNFDNYALLTGSQFFNGQNTFIGNTITSGIISGSQKVMLQGESIIPRSSWPLSSMSAQQQAMYVTSGVGGELYFETEAVGGGDIDYIFNESKYTLDCTNGDGAGGRAQVEITAGTDVDPTRNYIFATGDAGSAYLSSSTTVPTGEFAWVGIITAQSTETTIAEGPIQAQRMTEALKHNGRGALSYMREKLRWIGAKVLNDGGLAQTLTITPNGATPDNVNLTTTAGVVFQLHRQTFGAHDVSTDGIWVANSQGLGSLVNFQKLTDLNGILELADGTAINNNERFTLVVWGSMNSSINGAGDCKLFVNLPNGVYGSDSAAITDSNGYSVYTVPPEFETTAFLICRITLKYTTASGGTWTEVETRSLLGQPLGVAGGGVVNSALTSFDDSSFEIYDNADATKVLNFELSPLTASNTRTITARDSDGVLAYTGDFLQFHNATGDLSSRVTDLEATGVTSLEALAGDLDLVGAGTVTITTNDVDSITISGAEGAGGSSVTTIPFEFNGVGSALETGLRSNYRRMDEDKTISQWTMYSHSDANRTTGLATEASVTAKIQKTTYIAPYSPTDLVTMTITSGNMSSQAAGLSVAVNSGDNLFITLTSVDTGVTLLDGTFEIE